MKSTKDMIPKDPAYSRRWREKQCCVDNCRKISLVSSHIANTSKYEKALIIATICIENVQCQSFKTQHQYADNTTICFLVTNTKSLHYLQYIC